MWTSYNLNDFLIMVTRLDNSVYNYGMIKKVVDKLKDKTQNFLFSKECHNSSKVFCSKSESWTVILHKMVVVLDN